MAIQLRRGVYADFDPTKLMPGEFAVVTEDDPDGTGGQAIYMCFGSGVVKRIVGADDLGDLLEIPIDVGGGTKSIKANGALSANGNYSFATGSNTVANGHYSHAEGNNTEATGMYAHAEGNNSEASGNNSHAESNSTASGHMSHAEGSSTVAAGYASHSEGYNSQANGEASHADGRSTIAKYEAQHVFGAFNVVDPSSETRGDERGTYIEIVGNGTGNNLRSNARTLDWSGNEVLAGKLTVGAAPTANMDVTTKQYVDNAISGSHATYTDPDSDGNIVITLS